MPFEKEIKAAAEKYQIPFELLYAQVQQESDFNPQATSPCGARGLLQIMPATGQELGLKEAEFLDVEKNLDAGARYLRQMYDSVRKIIGSLRYCTNACTMDDYYQLALAAYNGGLGYTLRAINLCKAAGMSIRWENVENFYSEPRVKIRGRTPDYKQIRNYVHRIWARYKK